MTYSIAPVIKEIPIAIGTRLHIIFGRLFWAGKEMNKLTIFE
jgi:hypothetical protein